MSTGHSENWLTLPRSRSEIKATCRGHVRAQSQPQAAMEGLAVRNSRQVEGFRKVSGVSAPIITILPPPRHVQSMFALMREGMPKSWEDALGSEIGFKQRIANEA